MVNISLRVLSRPISSAIPLIHQTLGLDFDEKVQRALSTLYSLLACPYFSFWSGRILFFYLEWLVQVCLSIHFSWLQSRFMIMFCCIFFFFFPFQFSLYEFTCSPQAIKQLMPFWIREFALFSYIFHHSTSSLCIEFPAHLQVSSSLFSLLLLSMLHISQASISNLHLFLGLLTQLLNKTWTYPECGAQFSYLVISVYYCGVWLLFIAPLMIF